MADGARNAGFEPLHDAHAIEQVVFALQIDRPMDDTRFAEVHEIVKRFRQDLPGYAELRGLAVAIGSPGPVGPISPAPNIGRVLSRTAPDGTTETELRVERASVTFRTMLYSRWDAVWAQARRYFESLAPSYAGAGNIVAVGLHYVDKFPWVGKPSECRPTLLLRNPSPYLCPHVYSADDLWHSHTGAFSRVDKAKRLLNINVDLIEEGGPDGLRRAITIATVLTDLMNQPGYAPTPIKPESVTVFLDAHMRQLHEYAKSVFGDVINDAMSKRIALFE